MPASTSPYLDVRTSSSLVPMRKTASAVLAQAEALTIHSDADLTKSADLLARVKVVQRRVATTKASIVKPLNDGLRAIRDLFRPIETLCEQVERILKHKAGAYHDAEVARVETRREVIADRLDRGRITPEIATRQLAHAPIPETSVGPVQFKTVREVVIEDESKIPDAYWVIDLVKVRAEALRGVVIPGVRVVEKTQVAARS